jgi:osmoprotectant transport system ATP-binding protein
MEATSPFAIEFVHVLLALGNASDHARNRGPTSTSSRAELVGRPAPTPKSAKAALVEGPGRTLLRDLNLAISTGETLVLLGRSGSGKTTILKLINRLLEPTSGHVLVQGKPTTSWDPVALRRNIGYAIQEVGLFPHYSVEKNVGLVPTLEHWDRKRIASRVEEVLDLVGLPAAEFSGRYPHELSGGQRQRVGLARALAAGPPILLMDEPFGALDPITRVGLRNEFGQLQQRLGNTIVFVTHDVAEALTLATRIALLDEGTLRGVYTPGEFVASDDELAGSYMQVFRELQNPLEREL